MIVFWVIPSSFVLLGKVKDPWEGVLTNIYALPPHSINKPCINVTHQYFFRKWLNALNIIDMKNIIFFLKKPWKYLEFQHILDIACISVNTTVYFLHWTRYWSIMFLNINKVTQCYATCTYTYLICIYIFYTQLYILKIEQNIFSM